MVNKILALILILGLLAAVSAAASPESGRPKKITDTGSVETVDYAHAWQEGTRNTEENDACSGGESGTVLDASSLHGLALQVYLSYLVSWGM